MTAAAVHALGISALALAGCAAPPPLPPLPLPESALLRFGAEDPPPPEPPQFADLTIPSASPAPEEEDFRVSRMREAALAWGARHGQARRSWELSEAYRLREAELDTVWNFQRVTVPAPMRAGWIIPPVVLRAGAAWTGGGAEAEAATEYYQILRPARLSPRAPGWRDYLPAPSLPPEPPSAAQLPRRGEEKQWKEWAAEGWDAGLRLADAEHEESLARLQRDFNGMLEFRRLLALGMLTDMVVEADHWPAAADEGSSVLRIGGRRVEIVRDAEFITDAGAWRPRIVAVPAAAQGDRT